MSDELYDDEYLSGDDYDDIADGTWTYLVDNDRTIIGFINLATNEIKYFSENTNKEDNITLKDFLDNAIIDDSDEEEDDN